MNSFHEKSDHAHLYLYFFSRISHLHVPMPLSQQKCITFMQCVTSNFTSEREKSITHLNYGNWTDYKQIIL